jgi:plasmid stabilization system protein ParE
MGVGFRWLNEVLLYRVDPDEIVVLAVMHQKRHPVHWYSRKQLK